MTDEPEAPESESESDDGGLTREHPLEGPRAGDALAQAWVDRGQSIGVDPADQMPRPFAPYSIESALAPWPTRETFVCDADRSEYVLRDPAFGTILARFSPEEVERMPNGRTVVPTPLAAERLPEEMHNEVTLRALGDREADPPPPGPGEFIAQASVLGPLHVVRHALMRSVPVSHWAEHQMPFHTDDWTEVEPIRPQCRHYLRQLPDLPHSDTTYLVRLCTARRIDYGDFMSLNDSLMVGCDMRDPIYDSGLDRLDVAEERVRESARQAAEQSGRADDELEDEQFFDAAKAVAEEATGSIFGGK